jgi:hypothetical protein
LYTQGGTENLHDHVLFLEGVYVDRTDQGLTPRFVKVESPSDADMAAVVETISHRVIRTLRQLGYLEAGLDASVATGYDPLGEDEPEADGSCSGRGRRTPMCSLATLSKVCKKVTRRLM